MPVPTDDPPRTAGAAAPATTLQVRLLGELDIRRDGVSLAPIESARGRALIGRILLDSGVAHSRRSLAFLLWPDSSESQARTNLRNLIHTLRRAHPDLDQLLEVTAGSLRCHPHLAVRTDVDELRAALARAAEVEDGSDDFVAALREVVELHRGELLEGCYDEWLGPVREGLRDAYVSALRRLARALAQQDDHAEAIRLGREVIRNDPYDEATHRLLMEMHAAAGDRAGAIRAYHECVATLRRELGIGPSPPTEAVHRQLMSQESGGKPGARSAATVARPATGAPEAEATGLVGRRAELAQLESYWRLTLRGQCRLVVVTGELGVGKTRLVEDLADRCRRQGGLVAWARSYRAEGHLGYGTVIEWLRSPALAADVNRSRGSDRSQLSRLLPELGTWPEPTAEMGPGDSELRLRLFDAVARALTRASRPTLLVADDAQWGDVQSLQLVHYLLRQDRGGRLLVVATARSGDLHDQHPLTGVVEGLGAMGRSALVEIERLDRAQTEALVDSLSGEAPSPGAVDRLFRDTEGNPLFIVEAVRAGLDAGGSALSPGVRTVISTRLGQLSTPARRLLGVAATVGRAFTAQVVGRASELPDTELVEALDELWRQAFIREQQEDAYDFSHGQIREVAYWSLSPALRRHHHRQVARVLESEVERGATGLTGQVALHHDQGGHAEAAAAWYLRASREAQLRHASPEAVRLLDRALVLATEVPGRPGRTLELAVTSALPLPLAYTEGFAAPRLAAIQRRVLELHADLGTEPGSGVLRSLVMSRLCRGELADADDAAAHLREAADRAEDHGLAVEADYLLGITAFWGGRLERARALFEAVVSRFTPEMQQPHLARFGHDVGLVCLSRLANTLWFMGQAEEASRARDEAMAQASLHPSAFSRTTSTVFALLLALDAGEADRVRGLVTSLDAEEFLSHPTALFAEAAAGFVEVLDGRPDAGLARIRAVMGDETVDPAPGSRASLTRVLLSAHEIHGDARLGLAAAEEALSLGGTPLWKPEAHRLRARFLAQLGGPRTDVDAELGVATAAARAMGAAGVVRRIEQLEPG